jgi:hypothetical protein
MPMSKKADKPALIAAIKWQSQYIGSTDMDKA